MEPGERLRRARLNAGLTIEQLAERIQRAPSTVRAHENGQNGIRSAQAARYAAELKVAPEWLLYGQGEYQKLEGTFRIDTNWVEREIWFGVQDGVWMEEHRAREGKVGAWFRYAIATIPDCDMIYQLEQRFRGYVEFTFLFVKKYETSALREGDHVVLRRSKLGFVELTLYEVLTEGDRVVVSPLAEHPLTIAHELDGDSAIREELVGVVLADLNPWRRSTPTPQAP